MGLMIAAGAETSVVLLALLFAAIALTLWEAHDQEFERRLTIWWVLFVALTHVVGYLALRIVVARSDALDRAAK